MSDITHVLTSPYIATVAELGLALFGVDVTAPDAPKPLQAWLFLSVVRIHLELEGDEEGCAEFDMGIESCAAAYKRRTH